MKIFIQIVATFFLGYWPILVMTSVMLFDAPGSVNNLTAILWALAVVFCPVIIGVLFYIFGQTFWGLSPRHFLLATIIVPILASFVFGYPKLLLNRSKGISSDGYFVKDDKVYYDGKLIEAKPPGFEVVDKYKIYARDADHVFFRGKILADVDAKTFRDALATPTSYYADSKSVIFDGRSLAGSDPESFVQLKSPDGEPTTFFKDKNSVYWIGQKITGLQASTVKALSQSYLSDAAHVFYIQKQVAGADAASFVSLAEYESWGKDKNSLFYQEVAHPEIDITSFQILERGYIKDKSKVFYREGATVTVVIDANPATFKVTNWDAATKSEATDGMHYFVEGKKK